MLINRIYYGVKPAIPWRLRIAVRRWHARRQRKAFANTWPIDARAHRAAQGWPGWPEGKRFAVVLTHDVEGKKGLSRVEQLMDLESKHGFRSSFNFVPEGEYRLSDTLRGKMEQRGFEIGVHGLEHDGKLYKDKASFAHKAQGIRKYLKEWGACGFRSPLMQHKLGWLHTLGADYDSSTFDTDPFEPEPDGFGTIFPFWVPRVGGEGYVELPYTLVQDFNLFIILQEQNIEMWKRKLDWIVEKGGMALLNTHPDYMCFQGEPKRDEFTVRRYEDFLSYVRDKYDGQFWNSLPREVAQYYRKAISPKARNTRKKICMVAYTPYEIDNRVRRYAETLVKRGDQVDVIAIQRTPLCQQEEDINGVRVYRVQRREHNERSKWTYAWRLGRFLIKSLLVVTKLHNRNKYDLIHVHNMPDFLVFAALFPKLAGSKVILDIHDLVPELFANKFKSDIQTSYVRLLKCAERISATFSDHVIISNHLWKDRVTQRSAAAAKCSVFVNHVDPDIFERHSRTRTDDKFIVLFPGSLQWHQGVDIAIKAFVKFKTEVPNAEFHIYCGAGGDRKSELKDLVRELGLQEHVIFNEGVPLDQMAQIIANADLGVVPKRADSFGNEAYSTKIMEFMSQGLPVVAARTAVDEFYFGQGVVHFFASGDSESMANAMLDTVRNPQLRQFLVARGYDYVERHSWLRSKDEYLNLIDSLSTESFDGNSSRGDQEECLHISIRDKTSSSEPQSLECK